MGINSDLGLIGVVFTVISIVVLWPLWFVWIPLTYFTLSLPYHVYYMDATRSAHSQKPPFLFIPKWNFVIFVLTLFLQLFILTTIRQTWSEIDMLETGRLAFAYLLVWVVGGAGGLIYTYRSSETWPLDWVRTRFINFFYVVGAFFLLTVVLFEDFFYGTIVLTSIFYNLLLLMVVILTGLEIGYFSRADLLTNASILSIESNPTVFGEED
ncbi:MAG: hypothetical protein ACXAE3_09125 [Candidatus Kariarchaeaceae archaeon]